MLARTMQKNSERFGHEPRHVIRRRVCDRLERVSSRQGKIKKGPNGLEVWRRGIGAAGWTSGRRDGGGKNGGKGTKGSKPDYYGDRDKGSTGNEDKGKDKSETRYCCDCGEQRHTNIIDEEEDQGSWESETEGEKAEELASLEAPDDEGEWCWGKRMDPRPAFHYFAEDDEDGQVSGGLNRLVPRTAGGDPRTWEKVTGGQRGT